MPDSNPDASPEPSPLTGFRFKAQPDDFDNDLAGCAGALVTWPWRIWLWFVARTSADSTYHVPPRFGVSAIIGITTALALLFALLRAADAHPSVYVFCTLLMFIIVLVQMRWGHIARPASMVAGAVWLPLFALVSTVLMEDPPPLLGLCCAVPFLLPVGGFFGYLAGTCAGGFFLLMEMFEKYWEQRMGGTPPAASPPVQPQLDDNPDPR